MVLILFIERKLNESTKVANNLSIFLDDACIIESKFFSYIFPTKKRGQKKEELLREFLR